MEFSTYLNLVMNQFLGNIGFSFLGMSLFIIALSYGLDLKKDGEKLLVVRRISAGIWGLSLTLLSFAIINTVLIGFGIDASLLSQEAPSTLWAWLSSPSSTGMLGVFGLIASGVFYVSSILNQNFLKPARILMVLTFVGLYARMFYYGVQLQDFSFLSYFSGLHFAAAGVFFMLGSFALLLTFFFQKRLWARHCYELIHLLLGIFVVFTTGVCIQLNLQNANVGAALFGSLFMMWGMITIISPFFQWLKPWSMGKIVEDYWPKD